MVRRSHDLRYLSDDRAEELDGVRNDGPGWWWRGAGDPGDAVSTARVLTGSPRSSVCGYDLIVAAPRPVSILVALDPARASSVVSAHRRAVAASIDYLERRALVVRDRRGGEDREVSARWSEVVSYTHGLNRHGEPHLHDHVIVGARPDGADHGLDSRALFAHGAAADAVYRAQLRHEIARTTPFTPWRSFDGVEHVAGLDEGYRTLWGGHYVDRGEKLHWTREQTMRQWASDLGRFQSEVTVATAQRRNDTLDEHAFGAALEGRREVTRRHVVAAWANAATFGLTSRNLDASIDMLYPSLAHSRGVRESVLGLREARMIAEVREHGPRPLDARALSQWRQRDLASDRFHQRELDRECSRSDRSR